VGESAQAVTRLCKASLHVDFANLIWALPQLWCTVSVKVGPNIFDLKWFKLFLHGTFPEALARTTS
jgi:hypothetical protein